MGNMAYAASGTSVAGAVAATVFLLAFLLGAQLTWRAAAAFKWDKYVFDPTGHEIRTLRMLVALFGGFIFGLVMAVIAVCISLMRVLF